jgi:hypothetical protein
MIPDNPVTGMLSCIMFTDRNLIVSVLLAFESVIYLVAAVRILRCQSECATVAHGAGGAGEYLGAGRPCPYDLCLGSSQPINP